MALRFYAGQAHTGLCPQDFPGVCPLRCPLLRTRASRSTPSAQLQTCHISHSFSCDTRITFWQSTAAVPILQIKKLRQRELQEAVRLQSRGLSLGSLTRAQGLTGLISHAEPAPQRGRETDVPEVLLEGGPAVLLAKSLDPAAPLATLDMCCPPLHRLTRGPCWDVLGWLDNRMLSSQEHDLNESVSFKDSRVICDLLILQSQPILVPFHREDQERAAAQARRQVPRCSSPLGTPSWGRGRWLPGRGLCGLSGPRAQLGPHPRSGALPALPQDPYCSLSKVPPCSSAQAHRPCSQPWALCG